MKVNVSVSWFDVYFSGYRIYRKFKKGIWYKHITTRDINQLRMADGRFFWARYPEINRYSKVIGKECH